MDRLLQRLAFPCILVLLLATGCDETPGSPVNGEFRGSVQGAVADSLTGSATQTDINGLTLSVDNLTVGSCPTEVSISTVRPPDTLFTAIEGVYEVTPDAVTLENKRLVRVTMSVGPNQTDDACPGVFRGRSGEVRVDRAGSDFVEGTLEFEATPPADGSAGAPTDTIRVDGIFRAARRTVEG